MTGHPRSTIGRYTCRELGEALIRHGDLPVAVTWVDIDGEASGPIREVRLESYAGDGGSCLCVAGYVGDSGGSA